MRSASLLGSESKERCPYKRQRRRNTETHIKKGHVKIQAEIGMTQQ